MKTKRFLLLAAASLLPLTAFAQSYSILERKAATTAITLEKYRGLFGRVHELNVVGNAQDDEGLAGCLGDDPLPHSDGVLFLHAENQVGPTDVAGGDFDARAVFRASRAGHVTWMIAEERLGGGGSATGCASRGREPWFSRGR